MIPAAFRAPRRRVANNSLPVARAALRVAEDVLERASERECLVCHCSGPSVIDPGQNIHLYIRTQFERRPFDRYVGEQLEQVLFEAAEGASFVLSATTGDSHPALVILSAENELTLYQLSTDADLVAYSFGKLAGGVLSEVLELAREFGEERTVARFVYSNPKLADFGGHFAVEVRYWSEEDLQAVRAGLSRLTGSNSS